jgi:hypothetical protein
VIGSIVLAICRLPIGLSMPVKASYRALIGVIGRFEA